LLSSEVVEVLSLSLGWVLYGFETASKGAVAKIKRQNIMG
jgi:hypothetical protein